MQEKGYSTAIAWSTVACVSLLSACAADGSKEKVYHRLQIEVHQSLGRANNIRFTYGDEFVNEFVPSAKSLASFEDCTARMHVPTEFSISLETPSGSQSTATVPIRSQLKGSVENKAIIFATVEDHVEGYTGLCNPYDQRRERFF